MKKVIVLTCLLTVFMSCDDIIEPQDISNEVVNLLAPSNNVVLQDSTVNLSWDQLEDAEFYKFQIATPTFLEAVQIVQDSTVNTSSFLINLNRNTNYQWRVKAFNASYETEYTTQSFSIAE